MEEEPTAVAPDLEAEREFIVKTAADKRQEAAASEHPTTAQPQKKAQTTPADNEADEFDLSDISHNPAEPSREDIIAAAEAAAFAEK
jgi:ribonuclease-3